MANGCWGCWSVDERTSWQDFNVSLVTAEQNEYDLPRPTVDRDPSVEQCIYEQVAQLSQKDRAAGWVSNG